MNYERAFRLRLFVALLFLGSSIVSLWLGLTESPEIIQFKVSSVGAVVLAISGIAILKLGNSRTPE